MPLDKTSGIKKILIVEDEFVVASDLRMILTRAGYLVTGIAVSVNMAIELLDKHPPDIVLLDIHLQGELNGIDLAVLLKKRHIAFVYLSANSNRKILEEAKATEPYGFLVKPFRAKDVLITLDIACYRHQHSLDSLLRKKEQLQKQLASIINNHPDTSIGKLKKLAQVFQPDFSFDFIFLKANPSSAIGNHCGLLRIGFNEYQEIDSQAITNITGITKEELLRTIMAGKTLSHADRFNSDSFPEILMQDPIVSLFAKAFQLNSLMIIPLTNGAALYFFGKASDLFDETHLNLV